ncbi:MAG: hypothetical protein JSU91_02760 [Thermoplasmatales archaeon]|nr:MAG: hypothetical protein JSU91_02760 [Thermoplasmatales archaeon]
MKQKRKILAIILISSIVLLMIYHSLENSKKEFDIFYIFENSKSPDNRTLITGEIIEINYTTKIIIVRSSDPPYSLKKIKIQNIKFIDYIPKKGDITEILGVENEEKNITAEKMLVFERWKHDLIYIRSIPAIPIALYLFFRTWHFNKKTYRFERGKQDA